MLRNPLSKIAQWMKHTVFTDECWVFEQRGYCAMLVEAFKEEFKSEPQFKILDVSVGRKCTNCSGFFGKKDFSSKQWRKKSGRRCRTCTTQQQG